MRRAMLVASLLLGAAMSGWGQNTPTSGYGYFQGAGGVFRADGFHVNKGGHRYDTPPGDPSPTKHKAKPGPTPLPIIGRTDVPGYKHNGQVTQALDVWRPSN